MNPFDINPGSADLAALLTVHLQDEEAVLAATLPIVRAMKAAFTEGKGAQLPEATEQQVRLTSVIDEMKERRRRFRAELARRLKCAEATITITTILAGLPASQRQPLSACVERIRQSAGEFLALNRWLAVHLRIHLDAYQRLLCDLTGTGQRSGRYGPAGRTEASDFRPLIQIQG